MRNVLFNLKSLKSSWFSDGAYLAGCLGLPWLGRRVQIIVLCSLTSTTKVQNNAGGIKYVKNYSSLCLMQRNYTIIERYIRLSVTVQLIF